MRRYLFRHADRLLIVLGFLLLIALSGHTMAQLSNLAADEIPTEVRLEDDLIALYTLNAGMNKPVILSPDGDTLLEFSGWNSHLTADGFGADLWNHAFSVEIDRARGRGFLTWSANPLAQSDPEGRRMRRYQVEQVVTLDGPRARVEYYVIPNEPIQSIRLVVGHFGWYLGSLRTDGAAYRFTRTDLSREAAEARLRPKRTHAVVLRPLVRPAEARVLTNDLGAYGLELAYTLRAPRPFERTLIAREDLVLLR